MIEIKSAKDKTITDLANDCLKQERIKKSASSYLIKAFLAFNILIGVLNLFINPLSRAALIISSSSVFISSIALKNATEKAAKSISNLIASRAEECLLKNSLLNEKIIFPKQIITDPTASLDIIPRNIKVGEDLEAVNAVPIFKEGHYVIVKSVIEPYFIRIVPEENGEVKEYLMEVTEEDICTLREEVPEYEEYIKSLELKFEFIPIK